MTTTTSTTTTRTVTQQPTTTTITVTRRQTTPSTRPQVTTAPQDYDYEDGPGFATDPPEETTTQRPRRRTTTRRPSVFQGTDGGGDSFVPRTTTRRPTRTSRRPHYPDNIEWQEDNVWTRLANFIRQINSGNVISIV